MEIWKPGQEVTKQGVFVYRCPVCNNTARFDDKYGPACTGPTWRDDHPMEAMELVGEDAPKLFVIKDQ